MRFFYVKILKKYILIPACITLLITLIIQFIPSFFMQQISILSLVKTKFGYPVTFFPSNTLFIFRLLMPIFYAYIGGLLGLLFFRLKHRNSGHTLLVSNSFKLISGISFLILSYTLLNSEKLVLNPINIPKIEIPKTVINSDFSRFLSINLNPYFIPQIKINPKTVYQPPPANSNSSPSKPNYIYSPSANSQVNKPQQSEKSPTPRQATPQELFLQLNLHRTRNGKQVLIWDSRLGDYAQSRADLYAMLKSTDSHAGFRADNASGNLNYKFQFFGLGENASYGTVGDARYIIEEWFGKSPAHNNAQLDSKWTHVGIGVNNEGININFGGGKTDSFHVNE